jgi:hypothetical protein
MASHNRRPRRPIVLSQLTYPLPDGRPDPQNFNDCGESCVSSVLATSSGVMIDPGALRQALGGTDRSGITTAGNLQYLLSRLGVDASVASGVDRPELESKVGTGHWVIALGYFQGPNELHWCVVYDYGRWRVWFMDPWVGRVRALAWHTYGSLREGSAVVCRDRNPR